MPELRTVTKVSWLQLREPFQQVYSRVVNRVDLRFDNHKIYGKIYRVGNVVRIDIRDNGEN